MADPDVETIIALGEPQLKNNFELWLPPQMPLMTPFEVLTVQNRVINIGPAMGVSSGPVTAQAAGNLKWKYFEDYDIKDFQASFWEGADQLTLQYFLQWESLKINSDGTFNAPAYYKKTLMLFLTNSSGFRYRSFYFDGVFPNDNNFGELSYSGSELQTVDVNFSCDGVRTLNLARPRGVVESIVTPAIPSIGSP